LYILAQPVRVQIFTVFPRISNGVLAVGGYLFAAGPDSAVSSYAPAGAGGGRPFSSRQ